MPQDNRFFNSQEFKEMLHIYEEAQRNGESVYMDCDDLVSVAEYYNLFGTLDQSVKAVEYAMQLFPSATAPLVFRARIAFMIEKDIDKAKRYVDMIEDITDLDYYYIKAEILLVENHLEDAEAYLHDVYGRLDDEQRADFVIDVAALYVDYSLFNQAQRWLDLSEEYDDEDYQELRGQIAFGHGDYEESEQMFNQLLDKDAFNITYWNQLASAQYMRDDTTASMQSSEFALAINPYDYDALLNKANCLFALGNFQEALEYYRRFNYISPDSEVGELYEGMTLFNLGRVEEGVEHLKTAEELSLHDNDEYLHLIYTELAYYLSVLGKYDEALEYLEGATLYEGGNPQELVALKGSILLLSGNENEGLELFHKAIEASGHSPVIIFRVATYIFEAGYIPLAYQVLHSLLDHASDDWCDGWSYLAYCCKSMHKHEEYLQALTTACERNPVEVKIILGNLFPEGLNTSEYVEYAKQHS